MTTIEEAFQKFGPELLRHASVLVGPDHAADLVSEAIIGAMQSKGWSTAESQLGYLHKSVLNSARMRHRSRVRRQRREWLAAASAAHSEYELLPRHDVIAAVRALSPQQRSVVYFTYWEDKTTGQVAEILGVTEGTVKKQLARGRERLRTVLND